MGRPSKPAEERLTERMAFRMTIETKNLYQQQIAASGLSHSEFIRNAVMTNATKITVHAPLSANARESLRLLKNIANNCNQIAHALNTANRAGLLSNVMAEKILASVSLILERAKEVSSDVN